MTKETEFNPKEVLDRKILEILRALNESMPVARYPKLNFVPMGLFEEGDYLDRPLLFQKSTGWFFLSYFVKQIEKEDLVLGLVRKRYDLNSWEYLSRIENHTRMVRAYSLSFKRSCLFPDEMADFARKLPFGSFLQIETVKGFQALGIFSGTSDGEIELKFGYDLHDGRLKDLSMNLLKSWERDWEDESRVSHGIMMKRYKLSNCRKLSLLELNDGVSGINDIPSFDQISEVPKSIEKASMNALINGNLSAVEIIFDCEKVSTVFCKGKNAYDGQEYSGFFGDDVVSHFEKYADTEYGEDNEHRKGGYRYSLNGREYDISIRIEHQEPGGYRIRLKTPNIVRKCVKLL